MLKKKPDPESLVLTVLILLSVFVLVGSPAAAAALSYPTYYANDYNVLAGSYISGSVPASLQTVDADYLTIASSPSGTSASGHSPSTYSSFGGTAHVSGGMDDLVSDNDLYMVYRSYASVTSAQTLYTHQEATTIGGNSYYVQNPGSADLAGTSLSASMASAGRQLMGKSVYPLTGMSSVPASAWTGYYRAWRDPDPAIAYDSVGSGNNGDGTANITWGHVVGSGSNRFMVIGVSVKITSVAVLSVTVGSQSATFLRSDVRDPEVRGEVWYLVNPSSGSRTVTVTLSAISKASGGSVSYTGVDQASPIDNNRSVSYGGVYPSVSLTTTVANDWVFSNLAVSGTASVTHASGQAHRYYEIGTGGAGSSRAGNDGDDRTTGSAGSYAVSWNMSFYSDVIAQAVAFKPAPSPVGHVDLNISILRSDGTTRATIAANVANSGTLSTTAVTLSGTYAWAAYSVVDQTDCLEIDYYVEVASATSGVVAYLRIDDSSLATGDQTRLANIMLPSEYTAEVEFAGSSNIYSWTQLQWGVTSSWTTGSVAVTLQLYDYVLGGYSVDGDGFVSYTSNATASTDGTRVQTILSSPERFRDAGGGWRVKVKGLKAATSPFDFRGDWIELRPTYYGEFTVSTEFLFSSMTYETPRQLGFTVVNEYDVSGVGVTVQVWNHSSSAYVDSGQGYLRYESTSVNETKLVTVGVNPQFYMVNGSARIRITALSSTVTQFLQKTNQIKLEIMVGPVQTGGWVTAFLYVLPLPFVFLLLWILATAKRESESRSRHGKDMDTFSGQFGMTHQQMVGKKMLLEIDPTSDYNVALSSFVSEALDSGESLFILTNKDSALHSVFSSAGKVNFLLLSSKARYPQQVSENETLLPASDLSVILDACVKMQQSGGKRTVNLLFDNLSDVTRRCGLEKTYNFGRLLLEAISSSSTTAVFVFIPTAHDQETLSSIRGLFHNQLAYAKNGPDKVSL